MMLRFILLSGTCVYDSTRKRHKQGDNKTNATWITVQYKSRSLLAIFT